MFQNFKSENVHLGRKDNLETPVEMLMNKPKTESTLKVGIFDFTINIRITILKLPF